MQVWHLPCWIDSLGVSKSRQTRYLPPEQEPILLSPNGFPGLHFFRSQLMRLIRSTSAPETGPLLATRATAADVVRIEFARPACHHVSRHPPSCGDGDEVRVKHWPRHPPSRTIVQLDRSAVANLGWLSEAAGSGVACWRIPAHKDRILVRYPSRAVASSLPKSVDFLDS